MITGRSVRLYLVDGVASGILTAEIMNWTGHVLSAPRTRIEAVFKRDELRRTGVYFLYGTDVETGNLQIYIGEGDDISKRIQQHNKEKDFWDRFIAVTSKDLNLTKAHVRYLESRLIELSKVAKKSELQNSNQPLFDRLPEADISDMESFLSELQLVLPVIGADFLKQPPTITPSHDGQKRVFNLEGIEGNVRFKLINSNAGIFAEAQEVDGEFIVLAGSKGSLKEASSFLSKQKAARDDAFKTGKIEKISDTNFGCVENISFTSPSAASVFLFGTSRNGRTDWLVSDKGIPYGEWKDRILASESDA